MLRVCTRLDALQGFAPPLVQLDPSPTEPFFDHIVLRKVLPVINKCKNVFITRLREYLQVSIHIDVFGGRGSADFCKLFFQ